MTSVVDICNLSLQLLGAKTITLLNENSTSAKVCSRLYEPSKKAELRSHPWGFAKRRASLASSTKPLFGFANSYPLPFNSLRVLGVFNKQGVHLDDYVIESRSLLIDDAGPVFISYIKNITDPIEFDPLFVRLLSARIALDASEQILQSNTKKAFLDNYYRNALKEARRINGLEGVSRHVRTDHWVNIVGA